MADDPPDLILGWLVPQPAGSPDPKPGDLLRAGDAGDEQEMKQLAYAITRGEETPPLLITFGNEHWGFVSSIRVKQGVPLFEGFCKLEGLQEKVDYINLGKESASASASLALMKQSAFMAFLCRAWARNDVMDSIRPLVGDEEACPFDTSGDVLLNSDNVIANHYLELLLGRGPKESCPQAEKYLQGIARDMPLNEQPYVCAVLEASGGFKSDESVLSVVKSLDEKKAAGAPLPGDLAEDLALCVAVKALQLVEAVGLDL